MFRRATVSTLQHLKRVNLKNPKLLQFHHPALNCLVFVRNESTGIGNLDTIVSPVQNIILTTSVNAAPKISNTSETLGAGSSENVAQSIGSQAVEHVDVGTSTEAIGENVVVQATPAAENISVETIIESIPEPPAIPEFTPIIEEVVIQLAANGEPTLASLGLGSWWPPGLIQQALEILHCSVGLPWWGAIALGTVIVRAALFPLVLVSQRTAARVNNNLPQIQVLQMKMTEARNTGNQLMAAKYASELMAFMKEKDVSPLKQMAVPLAMAPIFVSCFMGLRAMANLPVESMKTGGMLWFTDLTVPDPFYLLPLITSTTLWATLELGTDGAKMSSSPMGPLMKYVMRAIPIIVFPFTMNFPAALLCYWASTNAVSLAQVAVLKLPKVRQYFKIEALVVHPAEDLPMKQNKGFMKTAKESWTNMKISKEMEARERYDEDLFRRAGRAPITKTFKYDPTRVSGAVQAKQK